MLTVAHYWLRAEEYAAQQFKIAKQPDWDQAAKNLDSLVDSCAQDLHAHDRPMIRIESHLKNWKVDDSHSFGEALITKTGDCKVFTALYLAIGQTSGIPIWFELAPLHILPTLKGEDGTFTRHDTIYLPHLSPAKPDSVYIHPGTMPGIYLTPHPPEDFDDYTLFNLSTYLMHQGIRPASSAITRTLERFPDLPDALRLRAIAHSKSNKFEAAMSDINRAISVAPQDIENYLFRALIYKAMDQPEKAQEDKAMVDRLPPSRRPAHRILDIIG